MGEALRGKAAMPLHAVFSGIKIPPPPLACALIYAHLPLFPKGSAAFVFAKEAVGDIPAIADGEDK